MVKLCPAQMVPLLTVMIGLGLTLKLLIARACDTQPALLVPATVYVVLIAGFTTALPPCMVYVVAPFGLMVKLWPAQMVPLLTVIVGLGLTDKLLVAKACDKQPAALVPATV